MSMKKKTKVAAILLALGITAVLTVVLNYVFPTPWNIHSGLCWLKAVLILVIYSAVNGVVMASVYSTKRMSKDSAETIGGIPLCFLGLVLIGFLLAAASGLELFHSKAYADIIDVEEVSSSDAILSEKDAESIALMDTASAAQLGDREIGAIKNFSAFNVADDYIQLNVKNDAVKIAPLEYAGFFKWMKNKENGVTGYVTVSPTTMTADYVELPEGMQYVPSAYFSKDLNRHIHMQYPTLMYGNTHFEVDEDGSPYYISSVYEKTIGLFGGEKVKGAILTDPVSGNSEYYALSDIPGWVDDVVDGDLICSLYNISYKNKNGYWNGTFLGANTGCMQTTTIDESSGDEDDDEDEDTVTTDYGYIAKDGDIYIYTGVTSMAKDSSNLGFIMVNERTGQYRYFAVSGANEQSAMKAAEGEVQQYSYVASFPTLINVDDELTYIGVLKDANGLVKMYYMVNVKDYGKVVVASKKSACIEEYSKELGLKPDESLMDQGDADLSGDSEKEDKKDGAGAKEEQVSFTVTVIQYGDVDGNTYVYLGTEDETVYKALLSDNEKLLFVQPGDTILGTVTGDIFTYEQKQ